VRNGGAELFPHAKETLSELKQMGCKLIFLSNCRRRYWESHNAAFGLDRYFDYVYCAEDFDFIPKYEIFRRFRNNHEGDFIVIGDRFHDIETAVKNNLNSIGCAYGYGSEEELADADLIVQSVEEIPEAVRTLLKG
jgi:phosphoglycolate phosphatase